MRKLLFIPIWVCLAFVCCQGCRLTQKENLPIVHAHRGGAAVYPENTMPAMLHAALSGVPVLELDLHVTADSQVVVSHDAYLNAGKVLMPDGSRIPEKKEKSFLIYSMSYDSLRQYDAGSLSNPDYPRRRNVSCCIPLLSELIDSVESAVSEAQLAAVGYNVEIKSDASKDGVSTPEYRTFADLCMKELLEKHLGDRLLVQCFDSRTLDYLHRKYPDVRLSYLVEDKNVSFEEMMRRLDFVPQVFSPESHMLTQEMVRKAHALDMEIVSWTVDDKEETLRLKKLGVDAIITNCPDSVMSWIGCRREER